MQNSIYTRNMNHSLIDRIQRIAEESEIIAIHQQTIVETLDNNNDQFLDHSPIGSSVESRWFLRWYVSRVKSDI